MKKTAILGLGVAFSLALAGTSFARHTITAAGWAANGINASRHNLSTSGSHFNMRDTTAMTAIGSGAISTLSAATRANVLNGSSEMCAICHTPHFAQRDAGPIWNRAINSSSVTAYGTTIAKNEDGNTSMFSTLACLSCHDGVTTFNSLINKPGKGVGSPTDGSVTGTNSANWKFNDGGKGYGLADSQKITNTRLRIGGNGTGNGSGGTDLSDDHPIGVLYRGQGETGASASLRAKTVSISAINMNIETEDGGHMAALASISGSNANLWAVKGFISDSATIQDLLRSGNGQGSGNYVQCSSCHDLHYKNQTNPEAWFVSTYGVTNGNHEDDKIDGLFLRRVGGNSDSGLCRTCHDKQ